MQFAHHTPKSSTLLHQHRRDTQPCKELFRANLCNSRNELWKTQRVAESRQVPTRYSVGVRGSYFDSYLRQVNLFDRRSKGENATPPLTISSAAVAIPGSRAPQD